MQSMDLGTEQDDLLFFLLLFMGFCSDRYCDEENGWKESMRLGSVDDGDVYQIGKTVIMTTMVKITYNLQHSRSNTEPPMASRRGESRVRIPYWQTNGKPGAKG